MLHLFEYDNTENKVVINEPDILLIKEFSDLWTNDRNKTKKDPKGVSKSRAFRELKYIYLAIDWRSPYNQYTSQEKHEAALIDAELTQEEFDDPTFRAACRKYRSIQESNRYVRLLESAQLITDKIIDYFNNVDLEERDEQTGKYVNKVSDIQKAMKEAADQVETLKQIEALVKKEVTEQSQIRGGAIEGFMPDV